MPKLSCIMPTFNQGKFLRQTLDSILAQTFTDYELIIVDDGSMDGTDLIISSYKDRRISYFRKENGGTGSALNEGFKHATGQYETWFASDNKLYPDAWLELSRYLDDNPGVDYVYANCDIGIMCADGMTEKKRRNIKEEIPQVWDREVLYHHYFLGIVWIWRRELRLKAGEFQREPCEDYYFIFQMLSVGARFAFLDKNLGWFRRHRENMTHKIVKEQIAMGDPEYYSHLAQEKGRRICEKQNSA